MPLIARALRTLGRLSNLSSVKEVSVPSATAAVPSSRTSSDYSGRMAEEITRILPVSADRVGKIVFSGRSQSFLEPWSLELSRDSQDAVNLQAAAEALRASDVPVAFPTETVYGLGADATRSAAVKGIYKAKQRPSDNPLISHVCSLEQLRALLRPSEVASNGVSSEDPIPPIYHPLIYKFWPGPLTILLPTTPGSTLAPEVTAGLSSFGVRMPSSRLALLLIKLADRPLAAPSANASTKPSPTTAQHVMHDLNGRIEIIIDGGSCEVGVESTVVDGLSDPPAILRPGGIGIDEIRACKGWGNVKAAYKDAAQKGDSAPRAPGMKYKHYSPKAKVVLFENGAQPSQKTIHEHLRSGQLLGVVRTLRWQTGCGLIQQDNATTVEDSETIDMVNGDVDKTKDIQSARKFSLTIPGADHAELWDISLGKTTESIARGLFSVLRDLDEKGVDVIFVEGISDTSGDLAAAIMNRLRKAAELHVQP